jgi:hypothetical protein
MKVAAVACWLCCLCCLLLAPGLARADGAPPSTGAARPPLRRFALVIGNNAPPHAGLSPLRYADDDAVRWAVMLDALGGDVEVLTELDAESQRLYGPLAFHANPPSREALRAAVGRLAARIAGAHAQGAPTVFYFIYAGHGDVEDGQGYLALTDGRFTRAELGPMVLVPTGADTNHVIIDACRASSFLGSRGPGGERHPWQDAYFAPNAPRLANTGFLLASSSSGLSHEWEEFQGGVFSHEVRSGLLGAADVNGDGLVTYAELTGFVHLANLPVNNERFRPRIVSRPPAGGDDVLVDLRGARGGSLTLGPLAVSSHELLEDRAGVRWADFHPGTTGHVHLILPRPAWSADGFYLRSLANDDEYAIPAGRDVHLAELAPQPSHALRRGALSDAFTHLFDLTFDQGALNQFDLEVDLRAEAPPRAPGADLSSSRATKVVAIGALATGGAALVVAGGFVISALNVQHTAEQANGQDRVVYNAEIDTRNRWALVTGVGGGVLAALGLGLMLWRHHAEEPATLLW